MTIERHTVHINDDTGRIAMLEKRTYGNSIDDHDTAETLTRYIYSNHLQSASLELDQDARIISYEEYHPYGTTSFQSNDATVHANAKRYRYTGKERDEESGLYYHGARYYIPWLCRWSAVDPLESEYAGWSPYHYVKCNPVMDTDSTGMGGDDDWHPPMVSESVGSIGFSDNFTSFGNLLPEVNVETNSKAKDERIANNAEGHFFGMGKSNNDVAISWANTEWYGGYIVGDTLHYLVGHNAMTRDEYGAQYHTYDDLEWRTIQVNDDNFGIWGDKSISGTSSRIASEHANYMLDRMLRQHGSSTEGFIKELQIQGALFAVGEIIPLMPSVKIGRSGSKIAVGESTAVTNVRIGNTVSLRNSTLGSEVLTEELRMVAQPLSETTELLKVGNFIDKGELTSVGRALQKHGSRAGSVFPAATGNSAAVNKQGETVLRNILTNPNVIRTARNHARFGNILEFKIPGGQGVRFTSNGRKLIGFIEP